MHRNGRASVQASRSDAVVAASAGDLAWLEGNWHSGYGNGMLEFHWSAPAEGTIIGMFRWVAEGRLYFCELLLIEQEGESVVLRLKNFDAGLREWEGRNDPMTFDLARLEPYRCVFDLRSLERPAFLLYEREDADTLHARFEVRNGSPESNYDFRFRRKSWPA